MRWNVFTVYFLSVFVLSTSTSPADDTTADQLQERSRKNLQRIAVAFHNYHEDHGHLPGYANVDGNGIPLLSWRVHLLPYLGHEAKALHSEFRLDEAWDSPQNKKLIDRMPAVYRVPLPTPLATGHTCYVVPRSDSTLFPPNTDGHKWQVEFSDIYQGLPNIVLVVEANRDIATPWTKPSDLPFDRDVPLAHVGQLRQAGFLVAWASGQISFVANDMAADRSDRTEFLRGIFEQVGGRGIAYYFELD